MQIKTGIDIIDVSRIQKILENKPLLNKIFSKKELKNTNPEHLAGIFACKEALFKAMQKKPNWLAIEVINKKNGAPRINLHSSLEMRNLIDVSCSISHDKDYAIANVVILLK